MYRCEYDNRAGDSGCPNERTLDFSFCQFHLNTPRGRQHVMDTIQRGHLTTPSQIEQALEATQEIPEADYQTTALEKMAEALDTIQAWTDESRKNLDALGDSSHWRYKDRGGQEQQRTEVGVYERALDRLSRHLTSMSKVAIREKVISLGKAQVDMMIRLMMAVITEMRLEASQSDRARLILLEKLELEANLIPKVEKHAREQLVVDGQVDPSRTGGVTGVSMRGEKIA